MRNVMVRCIFSALSVGVCIVTVLGQEIHRYQWGDQQVLADEWKPFVPGFTPQRQFETYPQRPDSSRQFFGKIGAEPIQQNLYKKSFQTAASANNIEPYVVPPILGSFNTFGLQTIQARNPSLEKNIKDNQFLDQASHLQPKYYPQNSQQPQRFPPAFIPPQPQYIPNQQQYPNQYRLEQQVKQQPLLQSPSRNIQTTVQVFPPNPPNHYQPNNYFLGVPQQQKQENYEDDSLSRKQNVHRPTNDFLVNTNNIATIYGSRDPSLSIPPPTLKPTPFVRNEQHQDPFLFENPNLKPVQRYETPTAYKRPYEQPQSVHPNKPKDDNPSKQVYEQLSHFGRPFSLPKESDTEYTRIKSEPELESIHGYGIPAEHYKKEKHKPSQSHSQQKPSYGRVPVSSAFVEVSTNTNLLLDYEPGKLQSVKTVTYAPQRDFLQFNEEDVPSGFKQHQNYEKFNSYTRTPFLPTPTESEEDPGYGNFQRITTPPQKLTSTLPKNHKYGSIQHGTRNRYPSNYQNQEPSKYHTSTEPQQSAAFEEKIKYATSTTTLAPEYDEAQYETTTRKSAGRRRKPSKNKIKDQTRHKLPSYDASTTSTINNDNYYVSNEVSTTEAPIQHATKRKQTKITTLKPEDDYPNYPQYVKQENYPQEAPNYPQFVKQSDNYPKEFFQSTLLQQNTYDNANTGAEYYNSEKEEQKENYPQAPSTTISTTSTTTLEPTTSAIKARIKNKYANSTRPRFSIKDYKRTTAASTQSTPSSTTELAEETADTEKKNIRKFTFATRAKNKTETTKPSEESTSESTRKYTYKPRTRPTKYRSTSTTAVPDTTTERVYTFKPSTSRYKTSTSKYYNRFRTTTEIISNDAEEPSVASSDKKPVRTMLFSAKRSSLLKPKSTTTPKAEEIEDEETDELPIPTLKKTQYKSSTKLDKADDASQTNIMTSSEEQNEKKEINAAKKTEDAKEPLDITTSSEEEIDDFSDVLDLKENEVTTSSSPAVADDRMDDADKVSKVSSLTSIDESDLPMSFFQKWTSNDNQNQ